MSEDAWMSDATWTAVVGFGGIAVGFVLSVLRDWFNRRRRLISHLRALKAEAELCNEYASTYQDEGPSNKAPSYRLPITAFSVSFPVILGESILSAEDAKTLTRFFGQVETINRGLDQATEMLSAGCSPDQLNAEHARLMKKTKDLVNDHYKKLSDAIELHLQEANRLLSGF